MKEIILLFIILFVPFVSSANLGATPSKLYLEGYANEEICEKIILHSEKYDVLKGELKFGENFVSGNNLKDYRFEADYFDIWADYENKIDFQSQIEKAAKICIKAKNPGKYKAILLYLSEKTYAGLGVWVFINIKEKPVDKIKLGIYCTPTIFLFALFILLVINNKREVINVKHNPS